MAATKAVREARARVAELEAVIAAAKQSEVAAEAAIAPAIKRKAALEARQSKALIVTSAGGQPNSEQGPLSLASVKGIHLGWSGSRETNAKKLAAALLSGEQKINIEGNAGSISYTLRGFLQRARGTDPRRLRAVGAAVKRREAAQVALKAAWLAEREAYKAAYEAGDHLDPKEIAPLVAARLVISDRPQRDHELQQKAQEAAHFLPDAERHLDHAKSGSAEPCPCVECGGDRAAAVRLRDLNARLDGLPTVLAECAVKEHGRHRLAVEATETEISNELRAQIIAIDPAMEALMPPRDGYWAIRVVAPRGWCRKGAQPRSFLRVAAWRAELEKAAKVAAREAARAAKHAPKRLAKVAAVEVVAGDTVEFTCPIHGAVAVGEVSGVDDDPLFVGCDDCETEFALTALASVKKLDKAAA